MIDGVLFAGTLGAALGCGLVAGVFFAFSSFVMKAIAGLPPAQGIAAMRSINVAAVRPPFMAAFLGTASVCAALAVASLFRWSEPGAGDRLVGGLLYLLGALGVTIAYHVPRNDALAAVDAAGTDGADRWATYVPGWTAWDSVRTIAALAAAGLFTLAFVVG